ncbi:hypothetical protein NEUTE1DRAFT_113867 [Neurospora tetrasperma FGSC 2508]|uniref:Uncharacterized protein n=1 Tax=Neurospora tetrasperma (strain FGSC 2508 / ATCC MYA-4615 / P0657) TaxID=510951 RepID=F8N492_NEUT8|nr:uncharacterized protein NEUTE1DRAFT_113867 [Neurospora tetrasperma FGSC 2508]EGO51835.1 hypothetical protein NEUTE1DRAFT_113867 [Neurospora tetrasperma FGSC 2508]
MASDDENFPDATIQNSGLNVPRIEMLADDIAGFVSASRPAKRKRDKMDMQDNLQDPSQTVTEENHDNNVKFSRHWKPPQGIITDKDLEEIHASLGSSNTKIKELRKRKAVREIALRKSVDTIDLTEKYQLGAAYLQLTGQQTQDPCKECQAGKGPFEFCVYGDSNRCGNCCHRGRGNAHCSFQTTGKENTEAINESPHHADKDASIPDAKSVPDVLSEPGIGIGLEHHPEPEPEHQKGGRELRPRPPQPPRPPRRNRKLPQREQDTKVTETATVGRKQQPDTPLSPPSATTMTTTTTAAAAAAAAAASTTTRQELPSDVHEAQLPAAVGSVGNVQTSRERCECRPRDTRPERQEESDDTRGLQGTETKNRYEHTAYGERDRTESRARDTDTGRDRYRERERGRTRIANDRSYSIGSPSPGPPNSILACLPPNTPVEIMRCLVQHYQNQADELRLEHMRLTRNRSAMALWQGEGRQDTGKDQDTTAFGRAAVSDDAGPSSILACLGDSPMETLRRLGLHYQFQADELRLECMRIDREERTRRQQEREREWERERGGREDGGWTDK